MIRYFDQDGVLLGLIRSIDDDMEIQMQNGQGSIILRGETIVHILATPFTVLQANQAECDFFRNIEMNGNHVFDVGQLETDQIGKAGAGNLGIADNTTWNGSSAFGVGTMDIQTLSRTGFTTFIDVVDELDMNQNDIDNVNRVEINGTNAQLNLDGMISFREISSPGIPANNTAIMFIKDNPSSKSELIIRFPLGGEQVLATEP